MRPALLIAAAVAVAAMILFGITAYAESVRSYNHGAYYATHGGQVLDNPHTYNPWNYLWWDRGFKKAQVSPESPR
jgi:hypothetical protein